RHRGAPGEGARGRGVNLRSAPRYLRRMAQARIIVNDTQQRIRYGHPWVFATQVKQVDGAPEPGDVVQVVDAQRRPLGQGYVNPASMIRVRMLTSDPAERVNKAFMAARVRRAWEFRQRMGYTGSCRVV